MDCRVRLARLFWTASIWILKASSIGYAAFINSLRQKFANSTTKEYFISGAPQCVFPDAYLGPGTGTALESAQFDWVNIQFYNNYCGVNSGSSFNFETWQNWATSSYINSNINLLVGVPGAPEDAGSGYVSESDLQSILANLVNDPNFGGVMMWEVSLATDNQVSTGLSYAQATSDYLDTLCGGGGSNGTMSIGSGSVTTASGISTSSNLGGTTPTASSGQPKGVVTSTSTKNNSPTSTTLNDYGNGSGGTGNNTCKCVCQQPSITATSTTPTTLPTKSTNPSNGSTSAPGTGVPLGNIVNGMPCVANQNPGGTCYDNTQYALCLYGSWIIQSCASGTVCQSVSGGFVCNWPS